LVVMIPIVFILSIVGFLSANLTSDPVTQYFGGGMHGGRISREPTEEEIAQAKRALGLDEPILSRYFKWCTRILQGDLGYTMTGQKVWDQIVSRMPVSLWLGTSSIIFGTLLGILLGVICARHQYSIFDYAVGIFNYLMQGLPDLLMAVLLIYVFAVKLKWFPTYGFNSPRLVNPTPWQRFLDHGWHLVLPITIMSLPTMGSWARFQRAAYLEVMNQDFVRTARSKGLSERQVAARHVFRNALLPVANCMGGLIFGIFGSSYIIETMFSLPGLGALTTGALISFDYNLMLSTGLIAALMGLLGTMFSDILIAIVDPRIRYE
jgi:peptide/nickel transport system permease protein